MNYVAVAFVVMISACEDRDQGYGVWDDATVSDQLAATFAPIMFLSPQEQYAPMSPEEYIGNSKIWIAKHSGPRFLVFRNNRYYWQSANADSADNNEGYGFAGAHLDHVSVTEGHKQRIWLEHRDDRPGRTLKYRESDETIVAPVYYYGRDWRGCHLISYWFFFGYSDSGPVGHQADWETVSLLVQGDSVRRAWFNAHGKYFWKDPVGDDGLIFADDQSTQGRVVGHFARNRHGTYWNVGEYAWNESEDLGDVDDLVHYAEPRARVQRGPLDDQVDEGHYRWDAATELIALLDTRWKNYGGQWGPPAANPIVSMKELTDGPVGPRDDKRNRLYLYLDSIVMATSREATCHPGSQQFDSLLDRFPAVF